MNRQSNLLPMIAGIIMSVIFGFSFLFTTEALDVTTPIQLLAYRFAFAALTLTILQLFGVIKVSFRNKPWHRLLFLALFQPVIYFTLETIGLQMTSVSEAGMIIGVIPVVVAFLAVLILKERPSVWQLVSILFSVIGVVFIVMMQGSKSSGGNLQGILFLFGAVLAAGMYNIFSKQLSVFFNSLEITYVMMWLGAITFNLIFLGELILQGQVSDYFRILVNPKVLLSVFYLGIISSVVAFFLLNFMLARIAVSRSAVFANLTTVTSIAAGVIFRNDPLYWFHLVGSSLILLGVYGTNFFGLQKKNDLLSG